MALKPGRVEVMHRNTEEVFWRTLTKFQKKAQKGGSIPREKLNQKFDIPVLLRKALLHTIARPKFGRIDGFSVDVGPCVS